MDSYQTDRSPGGAMMLWLEADLQATDKRWLIAFWHHPPYSKGGHDSDTETALREMRENALPILELYGVDLVLGGHSHSYERSVLLDGHYGLSGSLTAQMVIDAGDGDETGDGRYQKPDAGGGANAGAVYAVAGSSGKISPAPLNHPVMVTSLLSLGSMVLDIDGDELSAVFIDNNGAVLDSFTIRKSPDTTPPAVLSGEVLSSTAILLTYNEALNSSGANAANYGIDNSVTVISAEFQCKNSRVLLETSGLNLGESYQVTANGVTDIAGNAVAGNNNITATFVETVTRTLQDGVSPTACYVGGRDSYISENALPAGANPGQESILLVDGADPSSDDKASLFRWDLASAYVYGNVVVESAAIILNVVDPTDSSYEFYALKRAWTEAGVTWSEAAAGNSWETAGAMGPSDRDGTIVGTIGNVALGKSVVQLNGAGIAMVQDWIDNPANNHGVILANSASTDGLDISSREAGPVNRPALRITFRNLAGGGDDTTPPVWPGGDAGLHLISKTANSISLGWDPAQDNVAVFGYSLFRDGQQIDITDGSINYSDSGLIADRDYVYSVVAFDAAGNTSVSSAQITVRTDPLPPAGVHVEDIAMSLKPAKKKGAFAQAVVTIHDQNGLVIANVDVDVNWSGLVGAAQTMTTDSVGLALFQSPQVGRGATGDFQILVGDLRRSGYTYDSAANVEEDDCISRTTAGSTNSDECDFTPPALPPENITTSIDSPLAMNRKGKNWRADASVTVSVPPDNALLAYALVVARWSVGLAGADLGETSATTAGNGIALLTSPPVKLGSGEEICLLVERVDYAGKSFPQSDAAATCGSQ